MTRKVIREDIKKFRFDPYEFFDLPIEESVAYLQMLKREVESLGYWDVRIEDSSHWDATEYVLRGSRYETSAEQKKRLEKSRAAKEKKLASKRKRLEKLKKEISQLEDE